MSALLLVGACRSTDPPADHTSNAVRQQIEPGMTPEDVRRIAGPPRRTIQSDDAAQWLEYGTETHRVWIYVDDSVVAATPRPRP